jgi:6-phosphogluconate dehydrogenase
MELGMIGLGRMGANMTERLLRGGHRIVAYDKEPTAAQILVQKGARRADSAHSLANQLTPPRSMWLMVPAGDAIDQTIEALTPHLSVGDTIVDGGNSNYKDTLRRATELKAAGLFFVDVGTSGGVWGLAEGYSLMIGGDKKAVEQLRPAFETLAPSPDKGWGHVGPSGAGHFAKMVHNGIEYGLMQSFAEGFTILKRKKEFQLDLRQVADIWRHGSVVRCWLLDLISRALAENPEMAGIASFVADSGEGRWTVQEAIDLDTSAPVITLALLERLRSRDPQSFADKLLAALRHQFGGHPVRREE